MEASGFVKDLGDIRFPVASGAVQRCGWWAVELGLLARPTNVHRGRDGATLMDIVYTNRRNWSVEVERGFALESDA
jgi:hypothetical protein